MADLTSRLTVQLIDSVSGPAKKAGAGAKGLVGELQGVEHKLQALGKKKIDLFNFSTTRKSFNEAKSQLQALVRERDAAWKKIRYFEGKSYPKSNPISAPLKKWRAEYALVDKKTEATIRKVKNLSESFETQKSVALSSAKAVNGISYDHLIREEKTLRESIAWTNRVLGERGSGTKLGQQKSNVGTVPLRPHRGTTQSVGSSIKDGVGVGAGWSIWQMLRDSAAIGYDFQVEANKNVAQGGATAEEQSKDEEWAKSYSIKSGLGSPHEIVGGLASTRKAGVRKEAVRPVTVQALKLTKVGDVGLEEAISSIANVANAFELDLKTTKGATQSAKRISDILSYSANLVPGNLSEITSGLKFSSGMAAVSGLSPEKTAAALTTIIKSGLATGAESGVALRSMLNTEVKPTSDSRQAMAELGLNMSDFSTERRDFTADEAVSGMKAKFGTLPKGIEGRLSAKMEESKDQSLTDLGETFADFFIKELNPSSKEDAAMVVSSARKFIESQSTKFDTDAMMTALQDVGATGGHLTRIFNAKHGGRLLALFRNKMYQEILEDLNKNAPGSVEEGSKGALANGVGTVNSGINLVRAVGIDASTALMRILDYIPRVATAIVGAGARPAENDFRQPPPSSQGMAGEKNILKGAQDFESWRMGADVKVDTTKASKNIADVKAGLNEIGGTTVSPTVNTSSLANALNLAKQLLSVVGQINNATSGLSSKVDTAHADVSGAGNRGN